MCCQDPLYSVVVDLKNQTSRNSEHRLAFVCVNLPLYTSTHCHLVVLFVRNSFLESEHDTNNKNRHCQGLPLQASTMDRVLKTEDCNCLLCTAYLLAALEKSRKILKWVDFLA